MLVRKSSETTARHNLMLTFNQRSGGVWVGVRRLNDSAKRGHKVQVYWSILWVGIYRLHGLYIDRLYPYEHRKSTLSVHQKFLFQDYFFFMITGSRLICSFCIYCRHLGFDCITAWIFREYRYMVFSCNCKLLLSDIWQLFLDDIFFSIVFVRMIKNLLH